MGSPRVGHNRVTVTFMSVLSGSMVKNLPAMQNTQVPSLGQGDSLEKGMATHSSILVWRIPWTEEPDRLQSMGSQSDMTEVTKPQQQRKNDLEEIMKRKDDTTSHLDSVIRRIWERKQPSVEEAAKN